MLPKEIVIDWQAVEAIGVWFEVLILLIGLVAIKNEISSRKQERSERHYTTLLSVFNNFFNPEFYSWMNNIIKHYKGGWPNDGQIAQDDIVYCLSRINVVQKLIDNNLLDQNLLFTSLGADFYSLASAITNFEIDVASKREIRLNIRKNFEPAHTFLSNLRDWTHKK